MKENISLGTMAADCAAALKVLAEDLRDLRKRIEARRAAVNAASCRTERSRRGHLALSR